MRAQYHFRPSPKGLYAWDVRKLVQLSMKLPVTRFPLNKIAEIDEMWWFTGAEEQPTPRTIAEHIKLSRAANLRYPIILCADGRLMDGMHRCLKAMVQGRSDIATRRFSVTPPPDYTDVQPDDLPYD